MATLRERIDRIHKEIDITQVLSDLGYPVHLGGGYREQQFPCDLHGDGHDNKPSARVYPESSSWYCFGCSKARDAIDTIQAKEGITFHEAICKLEADYNLPSLPWDDDRPLPPSETLRGTVKASVDPTRTLADDLRTIRSTLGWITEERLLGMDRTLTFWEAVDQVAYKVENELMPEQMGRQVLTVFQERLDGAIQGDEG